MRSLSVSWSFPETVHATTLGSTFISCLTFHSSGWALSCGVRSTSHGFSFVSEGWD